jgi:hypothetical protein
MPFRLGSDMGRIIYFANVFSKQRTGQSRFPDIGMRDDAD